MTERPIAGPLRPAPQPLAPTLDAALRIGRAYLAEKRRAQAPVRGAGVAIRSQTDAKRREFAAATPDRLQTPRDGAKNCKARPDGRRARGRGNRKKEFVPWC